MIQLHDVWYRHEGNQILSQASMHVRPGEFVFLVGPSGAGKSTVLRLAHMEIFPTRGRVIVSNFDSSSISSNEIPVFRRRVGVIFQDFKLLPDRDVYENVAFALWATGIPHRKIKKRVFQVLADVGLSHKRYSNIASLSGGERQRVAIARALANEPFVLLADEPTGNLDPEATSDVMKLLSRINRRGTAILMATHKETLSEIVQSRIRRIEEGRLSE